MLTQCVHHTLLDSGIQSTLHAHRLEYVQKLVKEAV
jgi:hypothetical protein